MAKKNETKKLTKEIINNEEKAENKKQKNVKAISNKIEKDNSLTSFIIICLIIVIIWIIGYYLFIGPNALFEINKRQVEEPTQEIEKEAENENKKNNNELLASDLISSAYNWYNEAKIKYGSLVDVQVLADGTITKLNASDTLNLENEKLNINTLPTSLESMIISKDGIIVASKINYNNYCFTYNGEQLNEIEC